MQNFNISKFQLKDFKYSEVLWSTMYVLRYFRGPLFFLLFRMQAFSRTSHICYEPWI